MTALCDDPKIISLAAELGIYEGDRVEGILAYCHRKVRSLLVGGGAVCSIDDLERILCEKLNLTIIEVENGDDIQAIVEKYARDEKDPAFAFIGRDLTTETFATLLQRKRRTASEPYRYVAVIDCRGEKGARRFFTRWHEIAHVLTTVSQLEMPLHRSTSNKDALEIMMDRIAAEIGFFDPLFLPVLRRQCAAGGGFTFDVARQVRREFCPAASMEATIHACATHIAHPLLILHAALGYKKAEAQLLASRQGELFPSQKPVAQLRVTIATQNAAARSRGLLIPKRMRVPLKSVISQAFQAEDEYQSLTALENLNWWRASDGKALGHIFVKVEAMRVRDNVCAIIQLPRS